MCFGIVVAVVVVVVVVVGFFFSPFLHDSDECNFSRVNVQMFILCLQKKSNTSWCFFIVIVSIVIGRKYFNKKNCIKK